MVCAVQSTGSVSVTTGGGVPDSAGDGDDRTLLAEHGGLGPAGGVVEDAVEHLVHKHVHLQI